MGFMDRRAWSHSLSIRMYVGMCVKCETTSIKIEIHIIYEVHQEFTMAHTGSSGSRPGSGLRAQAHSVCTRRNTWLRRKNYKKKEEAKEEEENKYMHLILPACISWEWVGLMLCPVPVPVAVSVPARSLSQAGWSAQTSWRPRVTNVYFS